MKPVFEKSITLSTELADVLREQPAKAEEPSVQMERLLLAEKLLQEKKDREALERVLQKLLETANGLRAEQQQQLEEMQRLAIELAVAMASRLLEQQIQAGDFAVETLVRKVVERLDTPQPVLVFLHPDDLKLLQQRLGDGRTLFPHGAQVQMAPDTTLARGDVRAEAGDISVFANIEERLADLGQSLRATLPVAASEADDDATRRFEKRQSA